MTPTVVFYGSCQAVALSKMLVRTRDIHVECIENWRLMQDGWPLPCVG